MTITSKEVSVGTSETQLVTASAERIRLRIKNKGSNPVYIGEEETDGTAITTSTGYPLLSGESLRLDDHTGEVNAIVASGSENVKVLEQVY